MNLFVSFILRAVSVFIKDGILYAEEDSSRCFTHTVSLSLSPLYIAHKYTSSHGDGPINIPGCPCHFFVEGISLRMTRLCCCYVL